MSRIIAFLSGADENGPAESSNSGEDGLGPGSGVVCMSGMERSRQMRPFLLITSLLAVDEHVLWSSPSLKRVYRATDLMPLNHTCYRSL